MTVNQDPQSIVGFHPDGSPVQTQLSITFKELEYVTSNDKTSKTRSMQEASLHNEQKANAAAIKVAAKVAGMQEKYGLYQTSR